MPSPGPESRRCTARSKQTRNRCGRMAIPGGFVCKFHGGATKQVKRKAAERIREVLADAIDPDRVLREAGRVAFSDVRQLFDEHGRLKPVKAWPDDLAAAVSSFELLRRNVDSGDGKQEDVHKVRLWDKTRGLDLLAKHLGLLKDQLEVSVKGDVLARLLAGRKRVQDARDGKDNA